MANEQNLIPNSERSPQELKAQTTKGGINSGKSRRQKSDMRKAAQTILDGEYADKNTGEKKTGAEVLVLTLFKIATDPKNKQCISAVKTLMELTSQNKSSEETKKLIAEISKIKAETELTQAKAKALSDTNIQGDGELPMLWKALGLIKDDI